LIPQHSYGKGGYLLLYNSLSNCDQPCILNDDIAGSAVYNFTASLSYFINETIPSVKSESSPIFHWFSKFKVSFIRNVRNLNLIIISVFFHVARD
jgi:hypothetical protein